MNTFQTVKAKNGNIDYFEILVDGKPLAQHFVGRSGAHPSEISPLGWVTADKSHQVETVEEFLSGNSTQLESGRVPVLVCDHCGDIGCGAITVRISRVGDLIKLSDWNRETNYEPPYGLEWPEQPKEFVFDCLKYEAELRKTIKV